MLFFRIYQHLLPRARAWNLVVEKQLRQLFEGLSEKPAEIRTYIDLVYLDLFPESTREIAAWEKHFGITAADTEQDRRDNLTAEWQAQGGQDKAYIQGVLQSAGFDVYLHEWWIPSNAEAIKFNGTTGRLVLPSSDAADAGINFDESDPFTIIVDIRLENVNSTLQTIVAKAQRFPTSPDQRGWSLSLTNGGALDFRLSHDWAAGNFVNGTASGGLDDGSWHRIVWTYDGSGANAGSSCRCWVDGSEATVFHSGNTLSGTTQTTQDFEIGSRDNGLFFPGDFDATIVDGYQDEVALVSKELTPAEIAETGDGSTVIDYTTTSFSADLAVYWHMGQGAVYPTVPDEAGGGHHITMTGMSSSDLVARDGSGGVAPPPYVARDPRDYADSAIVGTNQCQALPTTSSKPQCKDVLNGPDLCNRFLVTDPNYLVNKTLGLYSPPPIPDDSSKWPYFIYVGAETFPDEATVPLSRRDEFERILLKLCPAQQWIVLLIDYTQDFRVFSDEFSDEFS